ncbi:hypothetical protein CsSME_00021188 [Camellia sinensis var. sinensis]
MVMEVLQEDMGESTMQCTNHPFKSTTTNPGGICAFCLQEKLGKLVSSSFPIPFFPSSSSSPSPSFRSDYVTTTTITSSRTLSVRQNASTNPNTNTNNNGCHYLHYQSKRTRIPFFLTQKKKKADLAAAGSDPGGVLFKRSKSTTTPRQRGHFMDDPDENSPRKRGFWSFFYLSKQSSVRRSDSSSVGSLSQRSKKREEFAAATVVVDESESPNPAAFGRRVSRSRSVGCGSKSFSGDFFERISTGFGDCTLRRVESQREGHRRGGEGRECIKERVKCGGIFSGFMITSSSSSSSYWVSSSTEENGKSTAAAAATPAAAVAHGRSKSWGWAFASPIRAFKPSSFSGKREISNKTTTPNLNAIPSLLTVRG